MNKLIAVCEFPGNDKPYEYYCELPDNADRDYYKYAVSMQSVCPDDANIVRTKRLLPRLQVLFIREFKPITDQYYAGELQRLVLCFGLDEMVSHAVRKHKIYNLKAALEQKIADMSVFEKIKSLGIKDDTITAMAEELKKLMEGK